jgi:hypothetical protein
MVVDEDMTPIVTWKALQPRQVPWQAVDARVWIQSLGCCDRQSDAAEYSPNHIFCRSYS